MIHPTAIIHPGAWVDETAHVGPYSEIGRFAQIGPNARVERAVVEGLVGEGAMIWRFAHVMPGAVIAEHAMIGQGVFVADGAKVGARSRIQNHTNISRLVTIEEDVEIGAGVQFCNARRFGGRASKKEHQAIIVRRWASVGSNSSIMGGVTIGWASIVGANSVVTHDVPDGVTAYGAPARTATMRVP